MVVLIASHRYFLLYIVWSNNGLVDNSSPYHTTASLLSELDKIHPLVQPLGPSNVTQDSSMKITLEKSIFMYFFA